MDANTFYRVVKRTAEIDSRETAARMTAAVLHTLRDRLTPEEALQARAQQAVAGALADLAPDSATRRQFITQLPRVLKSPLQGERRPSLAMDREALIQHVGATLGVHAPEARRALHAVWGVIRRSVSAGEIADFAARVPRDIVVFLEAA